MGFKLEDFTSTKQFKTISKKINQLDFYRNNNSPKNILKMVSLNNKSFGERMQRIVGETLGMSKATSTGHDAIKNGKLIEIKSSRYWVDTKDWCFQHIMADHKYDYLLCVGIAFDNIELYIIDKEEFFHLKDDGIVKVQGGGEGQGMWFQFRDMKDYLHKIESVEDFDNWIKG
jgi:hypothetical protein